MEPVTTIKQPATGTRGMVTSNHPLASLAGTEMLVDGGNAVDAAIATMFALTVVEPMMVTIFGAGFVNIRLADGTATVIDNYAVIPGAATPDLFRPIPGTTMHEVEGDENALGHRSVAVGGTLLGWVTAVEKYGRLPLARVMAPAIRFARFGFEVSPYLHGMIERAASDMRRYPETADVFLPNGEVPAAGARIVRTAYADTLQAIAGNGPDYLYHGPLGRAIADDMAANGGLISLDDIESYRIYERPPVRGTIDDIEIIAPPPPSSGGTHIIQMLKILRGFDLAGMGFGSADAIHLTAEAMKIAFADRFRYMADPMTTDVPIDWLTSDAYADARRAEIRMDRTQQYAPGAPPEREGESTTHCSAADAEGNVVATTNTLHYTFGSKVTVPGTGMLLNNCMQLMDPNPGRTNSIAPGKRILSSMSPVIVTRDGEPVMTLGLPGGLKIFGCVAQALLNVFTYGMDIQQAIEAPRLWARGYAGDPLELETGFPTLDELTAELARRGHDVTHLSAVGGGMNGLLRDPETGTMTGAACWRADGAPMAWSGGFASVVGSEAADHRRFWR